ncbi:MAG: 50S ribosomal protein L15e, partial [Candidatus Nanoarchaeia archaeon]|nr:50S ribosomal protein L15e [Candidatus Nanoarchaeia archaeon]
MGIYKYIKESWKGVRNRDLWQERLIRWRQEPAVVKIENPTRLDRARSLGYKAKTGFIIARVRVLRGGRKRLKIRHGRRSKHNARKKILGKNYQLVAEERANKNFINMEVLNSYYVAQDGKHYWYEVILVDPERPEIKADSRISWICSGKNRGRVFRTLTSAGRR